MSHVPKMVFFVKGKGYHKSKLASLEHAMRGAGIEKFNLVKVTSILPPNCIEVNREDGLKNLQAGQVVFTVMSHISSNVYNRMICASVGVAKPTDKNLYGYLSEHHVSGEDADNVGNFAQSLAADMLATALGKTLDSKEVETKNITECATVKEGGEWLTVLAAAIFVL